MRRVEYYTGLLATEASPKTIDEAFIDGTEPAKSWDPSWSAVVELPWFQQRPFYGSPKEGENMPEDVQDWGRILDRWNTKDEGGGDEGGEGADHAEAPEPTA